MRAVRLHETGPAENLRCETLETPNALGQVLVRVHAAGVCYRDVIDRRGGFPFMKLPVVPGHEFAGEVIEGDGFRPGDRVVNLHRGPCGECEYCRAGHGPRCSRSLAMFGLTVDGGYAEYVVAPASALVPLPEGLAYDQACFLACTAGVALRGLRTRARLAAGETVLITGASGGVGLHGIQVAKALGAQVLAVTSSAAKAPLLEALGAEVMVSADLAFHKPAKNVHVVLDCVGAPTLNASVRSVRPMGRVVVAGNVTVARHEVNPGYLILNEIALMGTSGCTRDDLMTVLAWAGDGTLTPVIADRLPLEQAALAHRRLEEKSVTGRLVLLP
jgi:D-arabinose 1-dehydrogenase-like Zn-dependent alcohol dehydrogenase